MQVTGLSTESNVGGEHPGQQLFKGFDRSKNFLSSRDVFGQRHGQLGHRPDHRRRWRATVLRWRCSQLMLAAPSCRLPLKGGGLSITGLGRPATDSKQVRGRTKRDDAQGGGDSSFLSCINVVLPRSPPPDAPNDLVLSAQIPSLARRWRDARLPPPSCASGAGGGGDLASLQCLANINPEQRL